MFGNVNIKKGGTVVGCKLASPHCSDPFVSIDLVALRADVLATIENRVSLTADGNARILVIQGPPTWRKGTCHKLCSSKGSIHALLLVLILSKTYTIRALQLPHLLPHPASGSPDCFLSTKHIKTWAKHSLCFVSFLNKGSGVGFPSPNPEP